MMLIYSEWVFFPVMPRLKYFCEPKLGLALTAWCQSLWNRAITQIFGRQQKSLTAAFQKARLHMDLVWKEFLQLQHVTTQRGVFVPARRIFLGRLRTFSSSPNQRHQTFLLPITKVPWSSHANTLSEEIPQPSPVDATHSVRLHCAAEKCSLEGPSAKGWLLWI